MCDFLAGDAERIPVWTRPQGRGFHAASRTGGVHFAPWSESEPEPAEQPAPTAEAAYALGFADGRRAAETELLDEASRIERLARAIEGIEAAPSAQLAAMLGETVKRLVAQVIGEVQIDAALLARRTQEIATVLAEETSPARIRLHPDDLARLSGVTTEIALVADPSIAPGSVVGETEAGWIEDSPALRLEKLRTALDRMGCPR